MRLALIGDLHVYRLTAPPWCFLGKRMVGQANLWLNRRRFFRNAFLASLFEHVAAIQPDLVLFVGDLTTTALPGEFNDLAAVLQRYVGPGRLPAVIVPGNHDRYTFSATWQRQLERTLPDLVPAQFPHLQRLTNRWHLLALDAAVPRLFTSRGRIGPAQLDLVRQHVSSLSSQDGLVVLCHYPILAPPGVHMKWQHRLADRHELRQALTDSPARVVYLHGHIHRPWHLDAAAHGLPRFTDLCAGAPLMMDRAHPAGQGFWEIQLPANPDQPLGLLRHVPQLPPAGNPALECSTGAPWRRVEVL